MMTDTKQLFEFVRSQKKTEWTLSDLYRMLKCQYKTVDYTALQALIDNGVIRPKAGISKPQASKAMFSKFIIVK